MSPDEIGHLAGPAENTTSKVILSFQRRLESRGEKRMGELDADIIGMTKGYYFRS